VHLSFRAQPGPLAVYHAEQLSFLLFLCVLRVLRGSFFGVENGGEEMQDARARLLLAIALSGAMHLWLMFGVAIRPPAAPASAAIVARLEPRAYEPEAESPRPSSERPRGTRLVPGSESQKQPLRTAPPERPALDAPPAPEADSALPSVEMPLLADPTWYLARELDVYPRPAVAVRPTYPARALDEGVGGEVTLLLLVDERGEVHEASVVEAEPEGYFEESSLAAYQTTRFEPAQKDGRSVRSRILLRVRFEKPSTAEGAGDAELEQQ